MYSGMESYVQLLHEHDLLHMHYICVSDANNIYSIFKYVLHL